jgi:hypothetical protein
MEALRCTLSQARLYVLMAGYLSIADTLRRKDNIVPSYSCSYASQLRTQVGQSCGI